MKITVLKSTVESALTPILKMVSAAKLPADFHPTLTFQSGKQNLAIGCTLPEQQLSVVLPDAVCDEKNASFDVNLEMFNKKVPAESEYSSQSYHCTIEVELPDGLTPQQLQEKVHGVFDFVRNSVEAELHNAPVQQQYYDPQANYQQYQPNQNRQYRTSNAAASPKQVDYLLSLAKRAST